MKKLSKKVLSALLAASILFLIASCGSSPQPSSNTSQSTPDPSGGTPVAESHHIIYAYADADGSMIDQTAKKFKELLEEQSDGRFTVQLYPNGSLGSTSELAAGLYDGTITMISGDMTPVYYQPYGVFEMQRLFNSREDALAALDKSGEFWKELQRVSAEGNIRLLSCVPAAYRVLSTNKEINSVNDLSGINIRLMESEIPMAFWNGLGANPTPISIAEVYIALQQGLVDSQENPLSLIISYKFYEQQRYVVETNHKMFFCEQLMNLDFYNSLPEEDRALLDKVCEEVDAFTYENAIRMDEESRQFLIDNGVTIVSLSENDYAKLDEVAEQGYDLVRKTVDDKLVDLALEAVGKK